MDVLHMLYHLLIIKQTLIQIHNIHLILLAKLNINKVELHLVASIFGVWITNSEVYLSKTATVYKFYTSEPWPNSV